ncbi:metallophosphoesterase [Roseiconus lacunae]|uniref:metallophosphoesterase n=1 Tax=Roseiconus lacunae TaxID=2605694 RepID=UPI001E58CDA2|nr:metallophosphoesterase [Roseiconus lacunae]MCD0459580.1 metallophosphoesterase [Roseiconus lacunae]
MQSIDILLVGDIHFPQSKLDLDYKDDGVSIEYAERISLSPLRVVIDEIEKLASSTSGILFCGDLTSWGDPTGYQECVDWLEETLKIKDEVYWKHDQVHVVPGNHDVDRSLCKPGVVADKGKFEPFLNAWRKHGLEDLLTLEQVRQTSVQSSDSR